MKARYAKDYLSEALFLILHRSGYPFAFTDRQYVLETLYNNLKDKSKVLVGKKLTTVRQHASGVTVICEDGTSYTGDVLAAADGVNSKAKSEMWRLADEVDPELVKKEKTCKMRVVHRLSNADSLCSSRKQVPMSLRYRFLIMRSTCWRD